LLILHCIWFADIALRSVCWYCTTFGLLILYCVQLLMVRWKGGCNFLAVI